MIAVVIFMAVPTMSGASLKRLSLSFRNLCVLFLAVSVQDVLLMLG